ncbi:MULTISPECIES: hypothetical protein [unclassified Bacteroides]|jgi:hypothetical protein|uniref:hypothetical protein n=1 Tax=unclassified Bacteroides TaxID=2646097 RepID=UPI000E805C3A|nr:MULTISPECIES: hypothetical protein [unclassified Bacteroides]RGN42849.1 hypothetical protein DXB63_16385 [Bacteroides sp. OM05-12]RHR69974.1 hypothetical protein DWW69_18530 [Bacteroides sp. AF16-49]
MERKLIKISENGNVFIPDNVQMWDFEIAELFGVMIPTIRSNVRAILESEVVIADMQHGGTVIGAAMLPDYYGLDMVVALAFRIHSYNAGILKEWILQKVTARSKCSNIPLYISFNCNQPPN